MTLQKLEIKKISDTLEALYLQCDPESMQKIMEFIAELKGEKK